VTPPTLHLAMGVEGVTKTVRRLRVARKERYGWGVDWWGNNGVGKGN
jgi:hypothetical protein